MIEHIPALIEAGIDSFKIEGRTKGVNYVAGVVKAYREAIDSYFHKKNENCSQTTIFLYLINILW